MNHQIVIATWANRVPCADSGDPASVHDITVTRDEFIGMVPAGCRVVGDDGFTGKGDHEKSTFSARNNLDDVAAAEFKSRAKSRHESFNSRMKSHEILCKRFKHGVKNHCKCFAAVLVLVQCVIKDTSDAGEPLDMLQRCNGNKMVNLPLDPIVAFSFGIITSSGGTPN